MTAPSTSGLGSSRTNFRSPRVESDARNSSAPAAMSRRAAGLSLLSRRAAATPIHVTTGADDDPGLVESDADRTGMSSGFVRDRSLCAAGLDDIDSAVSAAAMPAYAALSRVDNLMPGR